MSAFPPEITRGLDLALLAHRRGLLDDQRLQAVFDYYGAEGAAHPAPAEAVLQRLGGLSPAQVAGLGEPAPAPPAGAGAAEGRRFTDRLTLLELLGEGGMGAVWRAYDRTLRREVAVKQVRADRLHAPGERTKHLRRFEREARAMARVRHPACVGVYDAGIAEGGPYLVLEYVPGTSLRAVLSEAQGRGEPLDPRQVARWGQQLAEGLQACHDVGVVHRDVKPGNVLLTPSGQVRLTDFGIALDAAAHTRLTQERALVGTVGYMPPEQIGGRGAEPRSDVYALGATLYELLTGRTVFEADVLVRALQQIASEAPRPLRALRPDLDPDLERVVLKCLEKSPPERYPTAQALALDLARWLAGEPVTARPRTLALRAAHAAWRRRRAVARALAAVLLLGGALGALALRARAQDAAAVRAAQHRIAAALADPAAVTSGSLEALEQALLSRASTAVGQETREGLRVLAGLRALRRADLELDRVGAVEGELSAMRAERLALERELDPTVLPEDSPTKQRVIELQLRERDAAAERGRRLTAAERALAEAAVSLPRAATGDLSARLFLSYARLEPTPELAERWLVAALEADAFAGGARARTLRLPELSVDVEPADATWVLSRYAFDPRRGRQVPRPVRSGTGDLRLRDAEPGLYRLQVSAAGYLDAYLPVVLRRGDRRQELALELLPRAALGPFADDFVPVAGGQPLSGRDLVPEYPIVASLLWSRYETTLDWWRSFVITAQPTSDFIPRRSGSPVPGPALAGWGRWPVSGINVREAKQFAQWFGGELKLHGVASRARLPEPGEYHWALRGSIEWRFPWGDNFDSSFMIAGDQGRIGDVGENLVDCSVWGVCDLVSSVREFTGVVISAGRIQIFGAAASEETNEAVSVSVLGLSTCVESREDETLGFRVVLVANEGPERAAVADPAAGARYVAEARASLSDPELLGTLPQSKLSVSPLALLAALRHATAAVAADPASAEGWHLRGVARRHLGDGLGCTWDAWEAVRLAPERPEVWLNRAYGHARPAGDPELALADVERALELEPSHLLARGLRGELLVRLGRHAEGRGELAGVLAAFAAEPPDSPLVAARAQQLREVHTRSLAPPPAATEPGSGDDDGS